jgi:arabinofuranosyltransferase
VKYKLKISTRELTCLLAVLTIMVVQGPLFGWKPVDDAYISFRYAANFVNGYGLVFNVGERVEGYTNFLWTILLAICGWSGFDIVKAGMYLGVVFGCTAIVLTCLIAGFVAHERGWPAWLRWIPPILLACYPGWSYWAFSGMETTFLACLTLLFLLSGCLAPRSNKHLVLAAVFGVMAALTRWEMILLWLVVVFSQLFDDSRRISTRLVRAGILLSLLIIGFYSYFAWRIDYYGDLLPNTYYAKVGSSFFERLPRGLVYTGELAISWWLPVSLVLWLTNCRHRCSAILIASFLVFMGYVTWTGGDHFAWLRFYIPVLPIAAIMAAEVIKLLAVFPEHMRFQGVLRVLVVAALLSVFVGTAERIDYFSAQKHHEFVHWWKQVGQWAAETFPPDYRLAVIPAGAIPYLSRHPILDLMGLTDREIAHFGQIDTSEAPGHQVNSTAITLKRKPEIILGEALPFGHPPTREEVLVHTNRKMLLQLYQNPYFRDSYDYRVTRIGSTYTSYWILKTISPVKKSETYRNPKTMEELPSGPKSIM